MRLILVFLFLCFLSAGAYADLKDYRAFSGNESPMLFEYDMDIDQLYTGSAMIFTEGYPVMWEASDVTAVFMSQGEIYAAAQDGVAYMIDGACGGLIVPENTDNLYYNGEVLIASAGKENHFYYVPYCAEYRYAERKGNYLAVAGDLLCEANFRSKTVSDLFTGRVLYSEEADSTIKAVHGADGTCYFLDGGGNVEKYTREEGLSYHSFIADARILSATAHDEGFSGFSGNDHFNMTIDETGTLLEFEPLPQTGYCIIAERSSEIFCDAEHRESFSKIAYEAEKVMLSGDYIYTYTDGRLVAYKRQAGWVKAFLPEYQEPALYEHQGDLYFVDATGGISKITGMAPEKYNYTLPEGAIFIPDGYRDGAVFSSEGMFLWNYAELIRQDGNKTVYRHTGPGTVIYLTAYQ